MKTILVAEDDPMNRKLMRDLLDIKGYAVIETTNGREAVDAVREHSPSLVLMDIQMPEMDGLEAVKQLKAHPETAGIAVWALTSYAMPGDERRVREAGCDGYITKPINIRDLLARIADHFDVVDGHPDGGPA